MMWCHNSCKEVTRGKLLPLVAPLHWLASPNGQVMEREVDIKNTWLSISSFEQCCVGGFHVSRLVLCP